MLGAAEVRDSALQPRSVRLDGNGWGTPQARKIRRAGTSVLRAMGFAGGSMAPKVEAACRFAEAVGQPALIGSLADAQKMLAGAAGTTVDPKAADIEFWS